MMIGEMLQVIVRRTSALPLKHDTLSIIMFTNYVVVIVEINTLLKKGKLQ